MKCTIEVIRPPGLVPYAAGLRLQDERRRAVEAGEQDNALFLLEHPPTITMGRNAHEEHLLRSREELATLGVEVCEANRGGDVTYHGPGQLVGYPILNLTQWRMSVRWYLRSLEEVLIRQLAGYGLQGERHEGFTGVWVRGTKVAAIGVGVHGWVTFHGIALNVDPDMSHFGLIVPCGIADKPVGSLKALLGTAPPMSRVMDDFEREFVGFFGAYEGG